MKKGRLVRGKVRDDASFPVAPGRIVLPADYHALLHEIKTTIQQTRLHTVLSANASMIRLYWEIGKSVLKRRAQEGWGARVIDRLSHDLCEAFPEMKGFSPSNLKYMRRFAEECPALTIGQQAADQLPWFHIVILITRLSSNKEREWYAAQAIQHGWSRNILALQIDGRAHERHGKAVSNFSRTLPPADSDLATHIFKDPYVFDFLGTADPRREREIEQGLVDHIQRFLLELGAGFAFVGRQVLLEVGDQDFKIDLLFFHLRLRCYVIVELKAVPFDPAFVGQLNLYLSAADDLLRHPDDKPTIGLLLCRSRNKLVLEYALRDLQKPIGVAQWETKLTRTLPKELKSSLPSIKEIEAELSGEIED
ncbi:MAG: PDDEXK nuclease domain-containing protein [Nitrospiraceae bacterium]|nr:PDDEXK nuclease domain-containing protein [Nitrospiraceae bacterium]